MMKIKPLSCKEAEKLVIPYIEDMISEDEAAAFISHVKTCRSCYEELETNFFVYYTLDLMESNRHSESADVGKALKDDLFYRERELSVNYARRNLLGILVIVTEALLAFMIFMDEAGEAGVSYWSQITAFIASLF